MKAELINQEKHFFQSRKVLKKTTIRIKIGTPTTTEIIKVRDVQNVMRTERKIQIIKGD